MTHSSAPLLAPPAVDLRVLLCVIYLQGCRKWTLWLTKGWKMSSSQTSGAKSAWRDSAPLVMCWSVMAFIINTYAYSQSKMLWHAARTHAERSLMGSLFPEQRTGWWFITGLLSQHIYYLPLSAKLIMHNQVPHVTWSHPVCLYTHIRNTSSPSFFYVNIQGKAIIYTKEEIKSMALSMEIICGDSYQDLSGVCISPASFL